MEKLELKETKKENKTNEVSESIVKLISETNMKYVIHNLIQLNLLEEYRGEEIERVNKYAERLRDLTDKGIYNLRVIKKLLYN